jgi:hypothetical protein
MKHLILILAALSLAAPAYAHGKPPKPPKDKPPIEQPTPEPEPEPTPEPEPEPTPETPPSKPPIRYATGSGTKLAGQTAAACVCCTVDGKVWWTVSPLATQARAKAECDARVARYAAKGEALPACPRGEANRARKWFAAN